MELHRARRAAAQLADHFKADHPEIPWQQPSRRRNRIVHGYWSIDLDILLATATQSLPAMVDQLRIPGRARPWVTPASSGRADVNRAPSS